MSILNVFVYPDLGVVCADTECVQFDGSRVEASKLFPLPYQPAVLAFRASVLFQSGVVQRTLVAGGDFDSLSTALPEILSGVSEEAIALARRESMPADRAGCAEVVIVGFSAARSGIVAHSFKRETLADGFVATLDFARYCVSPYWSDIGLNVDRIHLQRNREGMKALALAQVRLMREREPMAAAGGRFIVAEITRDVMTIKSVCAFPAREAAL